MTLQASKMMNWDLAQRFVGKLKSNDYGDLWAGPLTSSGGKSGVLLWPPNPGISSTTAKFNPLNFQVSIKNMEQSG